jgi:hypothetical protein
MKHFLLAAVLLSLITIGPYFLSNTIALNQVVARANIASEGSITYSLSPSPTPSVMPTPSLTPKPSQTPSTNNVASINDGKWYTDQTWRNAPADNVFNETNPANMHSGALTWRIEGTSNMILDNAVDHSNIAVHGGDHIVMTCWIKTSGVEAGAQRGAFLGIDYYGSYNGAWARISGMSTPVEAGLGIGYPNYNDPNKDSYFVHWGHDWTFIKWDFIVPTQSMGDGLLYTNQVPQGQNATITSAIPWCMIWGGNGLYNLYTTWFSDFQFYINP